MASAMRPCHVKQTPYRLKLKRAMSYKLIFMGIDWTSVKFTLAFSFPAFLSGISFLQVLGFISVSLNICYNAYRLYLLHKNKDQKQ